MSLQWLGCCIAREDEQFLPPPKSFGCQQAVDVTLPRYRNSREGESQEVFGRGTRFEHSCEDSGAFHDCAETEDELAALRGQLPLPPQPHTEEDDYSQPRVGRDCSDLAVARVVLDAAREEWRKKVMDLGVELRKDCPELQWATLPAARRFLNANIGQKKKVKNAVKMFVRALELRLRDRRLYQAMRCEASSDARVIGSDLEGRPVIYMCARSQTQPLHMLRDQLILTLEAACRLVDQMGRISFIFDMHGLQPRLSMNMSTLKDLSDVFGSVYAERIGRVILVDFSRAAQTLWWMLKPSLSERSKSKFAFVRESKAREILRKQLDQPLYERVCRTFEINRDPNSTPQERALHARRTTMCDVAVGPPVQ